MARMNITVNLLAVLSFHAITFAENATPADEGWPGYFKVPGTNTSIKFDSYVQTDTHVQLNGGFEGRMREYGYGSSAQNVALGTFRIKSPDKNGKTDNKDSTDNTDTDIDDVIERSSAPQIAMTCANSYFSFQTITPTNIGNIGTFIKADAIANMSNNQQSGIRLAFAYATIDEWLNAGLNQSLFYTNAEPENVVGNTFQGSWAVPQVRLSTLLGQTQNRISVSFEDTPDAKGLNKGSWFNTYSVVGRLDIPFKNGSYSIRVVVKHYKNKDVGTLGYGGAFGSIFYFGKDKLIFDLGAGSGMGNYIYGTYEDMNPESVLQTINNSVFMWKSCGITVGYTHFWTEKLRSNLYFSGVFIMENENMRKAVDEIAAKTDLRDMENNEKQGDAETQAKKAKEEAIKLDPDWVQPSYYYDYNKRFHTIGFNTIWEPAKTLVLAAELNYNYRRTFLDPTFIIEDPYIVQPRHGKEWHLGLTAKFKIF